MNVFVIDSWDEIKKKKENISFRPAVFWSSEIVLLE